MGRLKKHIKVGGLDYKIKKKPRIIWEDGELSGQITYHKTKILLSEQNSEQYEVVTLLHEAIHAIFHLAGMEQEERTVEVLATGIFMLLRDNPWFAELIMKV